MAINIFYFTYDVKVVQYPSRCQGVKDNNRKQFDFSHLKSSNSTYEINFHI